jgi:thiol-disulfide isomerase/thioredoxin
MDAEITSPEQFARFLQDNPAALVYYAGEGCGVCAALRPKVAALVEGAFPRLAFTVIDCGRAPALAAAQSVFAVPTVAAYFEGKEFLRMSRGFSVGELRAKLERPYALFFG